MNQVIFLLTSFLYGLISGLLYILINSLFKKSNFIYYLIIAMYFIIMTAGYIISFLIINNGDIHLYLKIILIVGFLFAFKLSTFRQERIFKNKS